MNVTGLGVGKPSDRFAVNLVYARLRERGQFCKSILVLGRAKHSISRFLFAYSLILWVFNDANITLLPGLFSFP